jgi:hypothetical protein
MVVIATSLDSKSSGVDTSTPRFPLLLFFKVIDRHLQLIFPYRFFVPLSDRFSVRSGFCFDWANSHYYSETRHSRYAVVMNL